MIKKESFSRKHSYAPKKDSHTREITQVYEPDSIGEFSITSRVEHETKVNKNPQNDMIVYDIVKLLILALLENNGIEENFKFDFSTAFAVNTLLSWGVLEELFEE